jgi:hypothetical protein
VDKCRLRAFFKKKPSAKQVGELFNLGRNQVRKKTWLLTGHLFKLELVNSPECNRCKQESETASDILCDGEALATLRFRHLVHHFKKAGDFDDTTASKIRHFVE